MPVELEGEVGEGLADAVVEVAGDAVALLLGADGAQPAEPPGVVEGQGRRLGEAVEQLDVALGEVVGLVVLDRHEADHRAPGHEHVVEARGERRRQAGSARGQQVRLGDEGAQGDGPLEGAGELLGGEPAREPHPVAAGHQPAAVGVVEHEQGGGVEVEQVVEPAHGGVERLVEVERRRERLGDPVEAEQQGVGVGELSDAAQVPGALLLVLAEDPPGVAGDERDEQELDAPLAGLGGQLVVPGELGDGDGSADEGGGHEGHRPWASPTMIGMFTEAEPERRRSTRRWRSRPRW